MDTVKGSLVGAGGQAPGPFRPYVYRGRQPMYGPGLCRCGCGAAAPIATKTDRRWGIIRGEPRPYIQGHNPARARKKAA